MAAAKRNIYTFGLGTVGRDMVYTMVTMYLMFYLTDILTISSATLWWINGIMLLGRIFDALNDPIMGVIVDNTNTKYGKFKPWILVGTIAVRDCGHPALHRLGSAGYRLCGGFRHPVPALGLSLHHQ